MKSRRRWPRVNLISEATKFKPTRLPKNNRGTEFTPELKRVLNRFPLILQSPLFPKIRDLAQAGDVNAALAVASATERTPEEKFKGDLARKNRRNRLVWLQKMREGEEAMKALFAALSANLGAYIEKHGDKPANIPRITKKIRQEMTEFRGQLRTLIGRMVRETPREALKAKGRAYQSIFKEKKIKESILIELIEAAEEDAVDKAIQGKEILKEKDRPFKVAITKKLASADPKPTLGAIKWRAAQRRVLKNVLKKNITGQNPSLRIWDITQAMEQTMRREVASSIMQGKSSARIASNIKKYTSPEKLAVSVETTGGTGIYKTPFKNAMRIARTETNRAYVKASAQFAKNKPWVVGKEIRLSIAGNHCAYCEGEDGTRMSVAEFEELVDSGGFPYHPNCMCYDVDIIDENYLVDEQKKAA